MLKINLYGGPFNGTQREVDCPARVHRFHLQFIEPVTKVPDEPIAEMNDCLYVDYKREHYNSLNYEYIKPDVATMNMRELKIHIKVLEATISFLNAGMTGR